MSIKSTILAIAAVAITATAASADTYFEHGRTLDEGSVLDLGLITAEGAGVVEVYDNFGGTQGELLGTDNLRAGANTNVRVNTGANTSRDVIALVKVDGEVVASKRFEIN